MKADVLVIGGTAAGTAAAAAARRAAPRARIVLVDAGYDVAYSTCEMPMYAGGQLSDRDALVRYTPATFAAEFSVDCRPGTRVTGFSADGQEALLEGPQEPVGFRHLILATGARARLPEPFRTPAENVHVLRTLADADTIRAAIDGPALHHAVIVGGGYVGLEVAHALRERQVRVTMVQPDGHVLRNGLHAGMARIVVDRMTAAGVSVRPTRVTGTDRAPDGRVLAVRTEDGEKIGCQLVLVATGIEPVTDLAVSLGVRLGASGAIQVTDGMRTNRAGVWACGDAVEVPDVVSGGHVWAPLAMQAFRTGRVAGANAVADMAPRSGQPERLPPVVPTYAVHGFGLDMAHVGLRLEEALAAGYRAKAADITGASHSRQLGGTDVHVRLVYDAASGRILGAETIGPPGSALRMNTVAALIRMRGTVNDLEAADTVYHPLVAPMHDPLRLAARVAQKQRWD